ncbi:hypothetical protein J6Z48_00600 [bacterium]|nr:hypothetical protein [bacterium]
MGIIFNKTSKDIANATPVIDNSIFGNSVSTNNTQQLNDDLSLIQDAERKNTEKVSIAKDIANPKEKVAVSALSISNPFRGV